MSPRCGSCVATALASLLLAPAVASAQAFVHLQAEGTGPGFFESIFLPPGEPPVVLTGEGESAGASGAVDILVDYGLIEASASAASMIEPGGGGPGGSTSATAQWEDRLTFECGDPPGDCRNTNIELFAAVSGGLDVTGSCDETSYRASATAILEFPSSISDTVSFDCNTDGGQHPTCSERAMELFDETLVIERSGSVVATIFDVRVTLQSQLQLFPTGCPDPEAQGPEGDPTMAWDFDVSLTAQVRDLEGSPIPFTAVGESGTVYTSVPEPGSALLRASALLVLGLFGARGRRERRPGVDA